MVATCPTFRSNPGDKGLCGSPNWTRILLLPVVVLRPQASLPTWYKHRTRSVPPQSARPYFVSSIFTPLGLAKRSRINARKPEGTISFRSGKKNQARDAHVQSKRSTQKNDAHQNESQIPAGL